LGYVILVLPIHRDAHPSNHLDFCCSLESFKSDSMSLSLFQGRLLLYIPICNVKCLHSVCNIATAYFHYISRHLTTRWPLRFLKLLNSSKWFKKNLNQKEAGFGVSALVNLQNNSTSRPGKKHIPFCCLDGPFLVAVHHKAWSNHCQYAICWRAPSRKPWMAAS